VLYATYITQAEILYGIATLHASDGRWRHDRALVADRYGSGDRGLGSGSLGKDHRRYGGRMNIARAASVILLLLVTEGARVQDDRGEHGLVLEIGPAAERPLHGERSNYGGTVAAEKEIIENCLELEFGLTMLGTSVRRELSADLLFKKPYRFSPEFEFFVGVGPSVSRSLSGIGSTSASAEFALDFAFWPGGGSLGWYVEPTFSINPATGKKSLGVAAGLLIGIP
jgi:hypothetical protein